MILAENESRLFAPARTIEYGPWRLQLRGDELADIEYLGRPVLRGIRAVVRDHDWRTLAPAVESVTSSQDAGTFSLRLAVRFTGFDAQYAAGLAVALSGDELTVEFDGTAPEVFRSNRIGLVVLHRPDDAGRAVTITAPDQTRVQGAFPTDISPHQPFMDIAAMDWERDGVAFGLAFSGDIFETEDQRNWTDASFKTYSTPLSRPFPVRVQAGDRVHQSIRLTAAPAGPVAPADQAAPAGQAAPAVSGPPAPGVLTVSRQVRGRVPALGTSSSRSAAPLRPVPGLEALIVELPGGDAPAAREILRQALRQARELGTALDVRITAAAPADIALALDLLPLDKVVRIGVFSPHSHVTEPVLWEQLRAEAQRRGFTGTLIAGARSHFTEINRRRDALPGDAGAFTYSIIPQMHATEVPHIVESLPIQRLTALNALRIGSGTPLHLGPVTLKARFNAVSTEGAYDFPTLEAMTTDPLQGEDFTAAWLLGSIAALTVPGVESLSYFEAGGPRGLFTDAGIPTPALQVLENLAALRGAGVLDVDGSVPGLVLYPVTTDNGILLFAANLTPQPMHTAVSAGQGTPPQALDIPAWSATIRPLP